MRLPRFYVSSPLATGLSINLPKEPSHHAVHVLRLTKGKSLALFNGDGSEYFAVITAAEAGSVTVTIEDRSDANVESLLDITLVQAVSSGDKMDFTVQKAVELGVSQIIPVLSQRSLVRLDKSRADRKMRRWRQVVVSACEQCGRNKVPQLQTPLRLNDWLSETSQDNNLWLLDPSATTGIRELSPDEKPVQLLVGPEGGFETHEISSILHHGFKAVKLGPRVLRTETAGLASIAAIHALWGDFH